jgi:butyryl-CoA dehydrogenase
MNAFAMESALLRAQKMSSAGKSGNAMDMTRVFLDEAIDTVETSARTVLATCSEGDALRMNLAVLKRFTKHEPVNAIGLRRKIAARLLDAGRYIV